jgi:hypothetical protein
MPPQCHWGGNALGWHGTAFGQLGISTGKPAGPPTSTRTRTRNIPVPVYPRVLAGTGLHAGFDGLGGYGTREG